MTATYQVIMHEDHGGDRSVVGKRLGVKPADSLSEAADIIADQGAADVAGWVRRTASLDTSLDKPGLNPFYCGAGQNKDGVYTRFDIQKDSFDE